VFKDFAQLVEHAKAIRHKKNGVTFEDFIDGSRIGIRLLFNREPRYLSTASL